MSMMTREKAHARLGIIDPEPSEEFIKRQYRVKALQYHPDKNKSPNAAGEFQEIHAAYEFLMKEEEHILDEDDLNYTTVLSSFLNNIFGKEGNNELLTTILQRLSSKCEQTLITTLEHLDKSTLLKIYDLIKRFCHVLHLPESVLKHVEIILHDKHREDECILLNPTLSDLFENNLYRLTVNNFVYVIPLWHHELVYDNSGNDVIVKCFPMLDENIYIDDHNHIHVELQYDIRDLLMKDVVVIDVGPKPVSFLVNQLRLVHLQTITLSRCGISMIDLKNVFDISRKSDIILHIELTNFVAKTI
uniref:J domain-containing protein n=1 Tax=viral metagenome TaxID=1070528 RepID=A0A6C0I392_9ZZZZ